MKVRTYPTAEAFKQALEQKLRDSTRAGVQLAQTRQLLVFERFLARVSSELGDKVTLKGGLVLELRISRARTTNDVDLRVVGNPRDLLQTLQRAARLELGDFVTFQLAPDDEHPTIQNEGMRYEGLRFRATCTLAGKIYGRPFGVDVAFGEPMTGEPDLVSATDRLAFAGIAPPKLRLYPVEAHLAEKLHACTLPRPRPNSRVKDLPDIALLASAQPLKARVLRRALERTFTFRKTHALPSQFPAPNPEWTRAYAKLAQDAELAWPTLEAVTEAARAFLNPVLAGALVEATWNPAKWAWVTAARPART